MANNDFIEIYQNAVSDEICDEFIRYFNHLKNDVLCINPAYIDVRKDSNREDESINLTSYYFKMRLVYDDFMASYLNTTDSCIKDYLEKYQVLKSQKLSMKDVKIQKTSIGGGFHTWHYEANPLEYTDRVLVTQLYLNDDFEGGETEFLYLNKRIKPNKGSVIIYPAGFTHTHRGNPPLTNEKYIITGWINMC